MDTAGAAMDTATLASVPPGVSTVTPRDPITPSTVALMTAWPAATAVIIPADETDATLGAELAQPTVRPVSARPCPSFGVAVACDVWPIVSEVDVAVTLTEATGVTGALATEMETDA